MKRSGIQGKWRDGSIGCLAYDAAATVTPFLPGGMGAAKFAGKGVMGIEKSLGNNPFKDKTIEQIDDMFRRKGFEPKGPVPLKGQPA